MKKISSIASATSSEELSGVMSTYTSYLDDINNKITKYSFSLNDYFSYNDWYLTGETKEYTKGNYKYKYQAKISITKGNTIANLQGMINKINRIKTLIKNNLEKESKLLSELSGCIKDYTNKIEGGLQNIKGKTLEGNVFDNLSSNKIDALDKDYIDLNNINYKDGEWDGDLTFKLQDNGTYLILKNGSIPMGFTTAAGVAGLYRKMNKDYNTNGTGPMGSSNGHALTSKGKSNISTSADYLDSLSDEEIVSRGLSLGDDGKKFRKDLKQYAKSHYNRVSDSGKKILEGSEQYNLQDDAIFNAVVTKEVKVSDITKVEYKNNGVLDDTISIHTRNGKVYDYDVDNNIINKTIAYSKTTDESGKIKQFNSERLINHINGQFVAPKITISPAPRGIEAATGAVSTSVKSATENASKMISSLKLPK